MRDTEKKGSRESFKDRLPKWGRFVAGVRGKDLEKEL